MNFEANLQNLGIRIPPAAKPVGNYVAALRAGNFVYSSGQLPIHEGTLILTGKVPGDVPLDEAQKCAYQACLNALAAIRGVLGSLDAVQRVVRLNVFVNSSAGFTEQAKVANKASELLVQVFGDAGIHTRCAVGVAELPLHAPVELDLIVLV